MKSEALIFELGLISHRKISNGFTVVISQNIRKGDMS